MLGKIPAVAKANQLRCSTSCSDFCSAGTTHRVAQFFAGLFTTVGLMRTDAERDADNRDKMWERDNQKRQEFKAAASPAAPVLGTYRLCQVPPQPRRPQQHLIACDLAIRCPPAAANAGACATRFTQTCRTCSPSSAFSRPGQPFGMELLFVLCRLGGCL